VFFLKLVIIYSYFNTSLFKKKSNQVWNISLGLLHEHFTIQVVDCEQTYADHTDILDTQLVNQIASTGVNLFIHCVQSHSCQLQLYHQHFTHHHIVNAHTYWVDTDMLDIQLVNQLTWVGINLSVHDVQSHICHCGLFHQHFTHHHVVNAHVE